MPDALPGGSSSSGGTFPWINVADTGEAPIWWNGKQYINGGAKPSNDATNSNFQRVTMGDGTVANYDPDTGLYYQPGSMTPIDPAAHGKPSSGGGGGGGSTSPTNVYISQNPGNLYRTVTSDGSDGFPAGTVYQVNGVTGDINIQYRPPAAGNYNNPLDKNNDGLNDSTGWANGVFKDSSSPSGFYYASNGQYIPVTPDGAPYNGQDLSGGGGASKTWNGTGPDGRYGTWILGSDGMPKTYLGDPRSPSNASAASSGTPRVSSGSSGGSSGSASASAAINAAASAASDAARAAQQAAHDAWQGNQNDADRNWKAAQSAIDRALKLATDHAQFELTRTGLVQSQTKMLLDGAKQFADLVSSTDPIKYRAFLEANGGNVWAGLAGGGTAVSDNANLGAARTLQALENPTHIPTWQEVMGGAGGGAFDPLNPPTTGAGGVPIGYGNDNQQNGQPAGGGVPVGGATGNTGGTTGAGGVANNPAINLTQDVPPQYGQRVLGSTPSGGWEMDPTTGMPAIDPMTGQQIWNPNLGATMPTVSGGAAGFGNFDLGQQIGQPLTVGQRNNIADTGYGNYAGGVLGDQRGIGITGAQLQNALGTSQVQQPYGNDQINHVIPTTTQAVLPNVSKFATGGVMVGGMGIAGDSHTGRPNEEMVVNLNPDPNDRVAIVPMRDVRQMGMHMALAKAMQRGPVPVGGANQMPMAADGGIFGGDSLLNPVTAADQPYLDRVNAIRTATDFSGWNPFRADYNYLDPTIRDANEKAVQAARGIPQASLQAYAQRYALPGISRGAVRIGM